MRKRACFSYLSLDILLVLGLWEVLNLLGRNSRVSITQEEEEKEEEEPANFHLEGLSGCQVVVVVVVCCRLHL